MVDMDVIISFHLPIKRRQIAHYAEYAETLRWRHTQTQQLFVSISLWLVLDNKVKAALNRRDLPRIGTTCNHLAFDCQQTQAKTVWSLGSVWTTIQTAAVATEGAGTAELSGATS